MIPTTRQNKPHVRCNATGLLPIPKSPARLNACSTIILNSQRCEVLYLQPRKQHRIDDTIHHQAPNPSTPPTRTTESSSPTGYAGTPNGEPTAINKTISHCAKSSQGLYEQGTTWFTDGTSGWTQYCANNFYDGLSMNTAPEPQNNEPSPWVQGQIDWADCLNSGHSEEECREMLN